MVLTTVVVMTVVTKLHRGEFSQKSTRAVYSAYDFGLDWAWLYFMILK
jgi:hypothetical protein